MKDISDLTEEQQKRVDDLCDEIDPNAEDEGPMTSYPMPNEGYRPSIDQLQQLTDIEKQLDQSQYDSEAHVFMTALAPSTPGTARQPMTPRSSVGSFLPATSVSGSFYSRAAANGAHIPPPSSVLSAKLSSASLSTLHSLESNIYKTKSEMGSQRSVLSEIDSTASIMLAGRGSRKTVTGQRDYLREIRAQKALDRYNTTIDSLLDAVRTDESVLPEDLIKRAVMDARTDPTILRMLRGGSSSDGEDEDEEPGTPPRVEGQEEEVPGLDLEALDIEVSSIFSKLDGQTQAKLADMLQSVRDGDTHALAPTGAPLSHLEMMAIHRPDQTEDPEDELVPQQPEGGRKPGSRERRVGSAGRAVTLPPLPPKP